MTENERVLRKALRDIVVSDFSTEAKVEVLFNCWKDLHDGLADKYRKELASNFELNTRYTKNLAAANAYNQVLISLKGVARGELDAGKVVDAIHEQAQEHLNEAESYLAMYRINNGL